MATNFLQWNPSKNNQLSDGDYSSSTVRANGIQSGVRTAAASNLHNKLYYQISTMVKALADMLIAKGYNPQDTTLATLTTVLSNIMTLADMTPYALTTAMQTYVDARQVPTGSILAWPTGTPPTNFLECNGASLLKSTYASLYAVIGVTYGSLDANHFTLPDYRGLFLRGQDHARGIDPDRATRTNRGDGVVGDYVGTNQAFTNYTHYHNVNPHVHQPPAGYGAYLCVGPGPGDTVSGGVHAGLPTTGYDSGTTTDNQGGNETRPVNINVMWIIKY